MTPRQLAKAECANLNADGSCLGMSIGTLLDNHGPRFYTPRDHCVLLDDERCDYFEKVVLPLADSPSPEGEPDLQRKRAKARDAYEGMHLIIAHIHERLCPGCGEPLPKRRRLCDLCAQKQKRESHRESNRRKRAEPVDS